MANPRGNPDPNMATKNLGGRPKGTKNKFPTALKDKVLHACAVLEGKGKDLASVALKDPQWFYTNFVKPMLPKEIWVNGGDNPLRLILEKQKPENPCQN